MRNLLAIAGFEWRTRLRRLSTWVYFAVFFGAAMLWGAAAGGAIPSATIVFGGGKVWINSPYAIAQTIAFLGMLGLTVIAALAGRAVQQDFEHRTAAFFFTAPITRGAYLGGRFLGALATLVVVFAAVGLGSWAATLLPNLDPDRIGPTRLAAYVLPYLTVVMPNLVWIGGVFFCVAALTRRMLPVYLGSVLCLVGYLVAQGLIRDLDNKTMAAILDPFGVTAAARVTEYWSTAERNTQLVGLTGVLAWNRVLWVAVGLATLAFCYARFRFVEVMPAAKPRAAKDDAAAVRGALGAEASASAAAQPKAAAAALRAPRPTAAARRPRALSLLPGLVLLYLREIVHSVYFLVLALSGVLFLAATSTTMGSVYGTATWPVTYEMLELVSGTFGVFMLTIITFYAGELVWRERDRRFDQIMDALPTPTWLPLAAKLGALMLVPVILQAVLMLCGMAIQTFKGYHHYEPLLYLRHLYLVELPEYWLVCVLAIAVQALVAHKYVGHFIMIAYYAAVTFAVPLGFEHHLYRYGASPAVVYSDMNGYGSYLTRLYAFDAYYAAWALLLAVAAYLFWTRGTPAGRAARLRAARARFTRPVRITAGAGALAMAALAGFVFWNTNVENRYVTAFDQQARMADFEKRYKPLAAAPQPRITAVDVRVDLFPGEQRVRMSGHLDLVNRNAVPVDHVHLFFASGDRVVVDALRFDRPATLATEDRRVGLRSYALASPLAPGQAMRMDFDLELPTHGFTNRDANTAVVANGSFVNGQLLLPVIGYDEHGELVTDADRRKFGLAPKERMRDRDDPAGLGRNYITRDADFVTFRAEVTTDADQWAIAPGYLQREWVEGGRHHFVYAMDAPILDFFAVQSARYAVRRADWHGLPIEVYYQPGHEFNLDRMIAATQAALDYYSRAFGPYQHRQFRIIEFPRYASFAQAFPNTIPFSEAIGFIARVREDDEDDIDYPYYVTAHEAAHQWWAHQVVGGDVQGATMLSETLAQYSALMVMKRRYGEAKMQRFLRYELDRYLIGRAGERKKELPLARVENQDYIHYRKGSLVMYALADAIGEDNVNRALRAFRDRYAFRGPPYPNTTALLAELRKVTPPQFAYLIDDGFESIVLYDNRAVRATAARRGENRYAVTMELVAHKRRADAMGKESDLPLDDWIDVGVQDGTGALLYRGKQHFTAEASSVTVEVNGVPARAGIDPLNLLIDRVPRDNLATVDVQ